MTTTPLTDWYPEPFMSAAVLATQALEGCSERACGRFEESTDERHRGFCWLCGWHCAAHADGYKAWTTGRYLGKEGARLAREERLAKLRAQPRYLAEVQCSSTTRSHHGTATDVAAWLAAWNGEPGRSVAVYRVEADGSHVLVELRRTLARSLAGGTAPVLRADGVEPDATWQEALKKNDIASRVAP